MQKDLSQLEADCADLTRTVSAELNGRSGLCAGRKDWSIKLKLSLKNLLSRKEKMNGILLQSHAIDSLRGPKGKLLLEGEMSEPACAQSATQLLQLQQDALNLIDNHYNVADNALSTVCDELGDSAMPEGAESYFNYITRGFRE